MPVDRCGAGTAGVPSTHMEGLTAIACDRCEAGTAGLPCACMEGPTARDCDRCDRTTGVQLLGAGLTGGAVYCAAAATGGPHV